MRTRKMKPVRRSRGAVLMKLSADVQINRRIYFFLLSVLVISAAAGSFSANSLPDEARLNFGNYLQSAVISLRDQPRFSNVLMGFLPALGLYLCMAASGIHLAFVLLSVSALAMTGWSWGMTAGVLTASYGFKGAVAAILCVYLAQLIPTICYCKVFANGVRRSGAKKPKPPLVSLRPSFIGWGILLIAAQLAGQMVLPALARAIL